MLVVTALGGAAASGVAQAKETASACGPLADSGIFAEPPNVDVWTLPLNATGEHELILAVHRIGHPGNHRYCYRYTWNGSVQTVAPALRVRRGEHFALRIVNDMVGPSKGERVASSAIPPCKPMQMAPATVTHYVGYLNHTIDDQFMTGPPRDTNIHLHGFEGPASEEDIFLSTLSTPMHACEYHITIPATQPPGTYFYHPHAHGSSGTQVSEGLSGAWIVEPDAPQIPRSADHVILVRYSLPFRLDNMFVPNDGGAGGAMAETREASLKPQTPVPYNPFNPPPWPISYPMSAGGVTLAADGCDGVTPEPVVSVDGSLAPASLEVPAGQVQLFRLIDATSDSPKLLELRDAAGHLQPLRVVGLDGVPVSGDMTQPLSHYIAMKEVFLAPMSRADFLLTVRPGETLTLSSEHYCEGVDAFFQMHHDILRIRDAAGAAGEATAQFAPAPMQISQTPAAKLVAFARANPQLVRRRAITFTEYAFPKTKMVPEHQAYYITDTTNQRFREHPFSPAYAPGATVPSNADVVVKAGTVEEWYLINATMESHVFHIHQMAYVQETSSAGVPVTVDTTFVPVGRLLPNHREPNFPLIQPRITKILLDFRHVSKGTFVFHCHMLFHEDNGMMAVVRVV
jgi:FtsP/CotA-like multicopper oxidase with cupredoxin domain